MHPATLTVATDTGRRRRFRPDHLNFVRPMSQALRALFSPAKRVMFGFTTSVTKNTGTDSARHRFARACRATSHDSRRHCRDDAVITCRHRIGQSAANRRCDTHTGGLAALPCVAERIASTRFNDAIGMRRRRLMFVSEWGTAAPSLVNSAKSISPSRASIVREVTQNQRACEDRPRNRVISARLDRSGGIDRETGWLVEG